MSLVAPCEWMYISPHLPSDGTGGGGEGGGEEGEGGGGKGEGECGGGGGGGGGETQARACARVISEWEPSSARVHSARRNSTHGASGQAGASLPPPPPSPLLRAASHACQHIDGAQSGTKPKTCDDSTLMNVRQASLRSAEPALASHSSRVCGLIVDAMKCRMIYSRFAWAVCDKARISRLLRMTESLITGYRRNNYE